MDKYNIAVLVDAKQEYTHQLIQLLYPHIYVGIKSIYDAAKDYCQTTGDKHVLRKFQQLLSDVPKWNTDRIENEYSRIKALTECDWMDDLITAVFVSHTKVLTAIQLKNKSKKSIELNVPTGEHFIHKCYTEVARAFWKRPYLLNHLLSNIDLQRNLADSEQLIKDSIHETVRRMLPVRNILKEYLGNDFHEDQLDTEEDITSQLSVSTRNNLRKMVQQEIEQTLSKGGEHGEVALQGDSQSQSSINVDSQSNNNDILVDIQPSSYVDSQSSINVDSQSSINVDSQSSINVDSQSSINVDSQSSINVDSQSNNNDILVDPQPMTEEHQSTSHDVKEINLDNVKDTSETKNSSNITVQKEEQEVIQLINEYTEPSIQLDIEKASNSGSEFERELIQQIETSSSTSSTKGGSVQDYDMFSVNSSLSKKSTASAKKIATVVQKSQPKASFSFFEDACDY
jgi:hypothetical protein